MRISLIHIQDFEGFMYVCICNAVTDTEIRDAVQNGARSLADIKATLGAATCCGRCADHTDKLVRESCCALLETAGAD